MEKKKKLKLRDKADKGYICPMHEADRCHGCSTKKGEILINSTLLSFYHPLISSFFHIIYFLNRL